MSAVWDVEEPRARHSDPETSHEAAASVTGRTETQEQILYLLKVWGPMWDQEIIARYAIAWADFSPSGLRSRRSELVKRGLVEDSGMRETLPSGRKSIIWRVCK